jgi:hypothetical protein
MVTTKSTTSGNLKKLPAQDQQRLTQRFRGEFERYVGADQAACRVLGETTLADAGASVPHRRTRGWLWRSSRRRRVRSLARCGLIFASTSMTTVMVIPPVLESWPGLA